MFQKLDSVEKRYEDLTIKISDPDIILSKTNGKLHERTCRDRTNCREI